MKLTLVLIPILAITVFLLIRAELRKQWQQVYILKPISTLLVIAIALLAFLEPKQNLVYTIGILIGLGFSFGGDVALMFQENRKAFTVGLGLFLCAQVAYATTFAWLGNWSTLGLLATVIFGGIALGFYRVIQPNLGTMRLPVIIYIIVISIMVVFAFSTLTSSVFNNGQAMLIVIGAVLFYISDIILAANRFWKPWQYHRLSLAFYYSGQACIALAASYFA